MIEFQDDIPSVDLTGLPDFVRSFLWAQWDAMKGKRVKLHWGFLRPSFKLAVFEPVIVKVIGPRP